MIQSPDPQDSAEYEAGIRQRSDRQRSIGLTSTSRFLRSSFFRQKRSTRQRRYKRKFQQPNRPPRTVEMHQVQSIDTVDHTSINSQRQVPRTGTAQWQDPGDVSCEATHVPMIQKVQKMVGESCKFSTSTRGQRFLRRSSLMWLSMSLRSCRGTIP